MVAPYLRLRASLTCLLGSTFLTSASLAAAPTLRHQADSQGDVVVIGSTLALDCSPDVPKPPTGTTASCGTQASIDDTSPDLFWRDTLANGTITSTQARTSSTLVLPSGAKVTYARLYWAALKVGQTPDKNAILDFKGGPTTTITADHSWSMTYGFASHPDWYYYQSTGDVTSYVQQWGAGDFRVSDVQALDVVGMEVDRAFSSWTLVVFYENQGDELRNLALFDGFTSIDPGFPGQEKAEVTLNGFLVPSGFSAKMTAFTYEGDTVYTGDYFTFNGVKLADAENPQTNFFNGSRSYLGSAVSGAQDVPKLSGKAGTMAGFDLDTANVTNLVKAGDTSAKVGAASDLDIFILGGFVTSITNKAPDFPDFVKTASDVNGGALMPGDIVEYTLTAKNTGNDAAVKSVLTDVLDPGLELVSGSIEIVGGTTAGMKTDAKDTDQADYDSASRTISVRLGSGATGTTGGKVAIGGAVTVKFRVTVTAQSGSIPNQGKITASGEAGGNQKDWLSDGDPLTPGQQPTTITIQECNSDQDCPAEKPFCDPTTKTCQPCKTDAECSDPTKPACQPDGSCGECSDTNTSLCPSERPVCNTYVGRCAVCTPGENGDASKCQNDPNGPVCRVGSDNETFCGCEQDSDCGGPNSGQVCDTANTQKCIPGCRGTDGNKCPTGYECTSKDSSIGECVPETNSGGGGTGATGATGGVGNTGNVGGGQAEDSGDDGGCGCRVPTHNESNRSSAALALLAGLGLLTMRRRRGRGGKAH